MQDLDFSLADYVKQANTALAAQDYERAYECIGRAAECALKLAKANTGKKRDEYRATFVRLKGMLDQAQEKRDAARAARAAMYAPKPPAAPVAPAAPTAPSAPTAPVPPAAPAAPSAPSAPTPPTVPTPPAAPSVPTPPASSQEGGYKPSDTLSPQHLTDYIGQPQAVTAVQDLIRAALLKNSAMPHIILYGSHGLGKTTFAHIIANEMHANFIEVNVSKITVQEMIAILKRLKPRDIVFIDEIHTLPLQVAESVLYSAMQDGRFTYTEGKGKFARSAVYNLPPFTLIGATTEIGKIAKPFIQRAIQIRLVEYTDEVLGGIIAKSFHKLGMNISEENALYISRRCRNNPRIANNMVRRISDKAIVRAASTMNLTGVGTLDSPDAIRRLNIEIQKDLIDAFFVENEIDEWGLEKGDRELLKIIITRYGGGPVGIDTLARVMNESNNVLAQKYEAYLIKKGMMRIDRDGRVVMPLAYKVLGLPVPEFADGGEEKKDAPAPESAPTVPVNAAPSSPSAPEDPSAPIEKPQSHFDVRSVTALPAPDEIKCDKIEQLITYPENAAVVEEPLDTLFPDIEKTYESDAKHLCYLEIVFPTFKRTISCDSFLESRFATCLAATGYVKDLKAQTVELAYISQELANHRYFPDFVIKDYKGRVAIIEMKNFEMMSYHLNIDKYEELRRFCESKGYGYAEIMKANGANSYVSLDMMANAPVNAILEAYILETIERTGNATGEGCFTPKDFDAYIAEHGPTEKSEIFTILLNNRRLKNIDRIGTDFKIVLT